MDFLKTLLAYMALMATLSVQEGPLPQEVPTPTPPPPGVTATVVPYQTEAPTATPGPSQPAAPTITPNTRYETLRYPDRGNGVRKMQQRLIELGYLKEGSADGAFGYQTHDAVREFQRANGLGADGVAGPATLTCLYENPNVVSKLAPTAAPTVTPTPPLFTPGTPVPTLPVPGAEATIALPTDTLQAAPAYVLTEVPDALIISGNTGRALVMTQLIDGIAVPLKPLVWQNAAGDAVLSLRDLVDCYEGWTLRGSDADGLYTLNAAGYEVVLLLAGESVRVTVDGQPTELTAEDVRMQDGVLYVTGNFLRETLKANVIFDTDERSLVLFIVDKAMSQATD